MQEGNKVRDLYFSVPYFRDLRTVAGWDHDENSPRRYSIIRCHCMLKFNPKGQASKYGHKVATISSPEGVEQTITHTYEQEEILLEERETFTQLLIEEES